MKVFCEFFDLMILIWLFVYSKVFVGLCLYLFQLFHEVDFPVGRRMVSLKEIKNYESKFGEDGIWFFRDMCGNGSKDVTGFDIKIYLTKK